MAPNCDNVASRTVTAIEHITRSCKVLHDRLAASRNCKRNNGSNDRLMITNMNNNNNSKDTTRKSINSTSTIMVT